MWISNVPTDLEAMFGRVVSGLGKDTFLFEFSQTMATASDLRAILSLPQQTPGASGSSKPSKAKGSNAKKPEGISRELYSLIGDSAPAVVAQYARPKFKPKLDIAKNRSKW